MAAEDHTTTKAVQPQPSGELPQSTPQATATEAPPNPPLPSRPVQEQQPLPTLQQLSHDNADLEKPHENAPVKNSRECELVKLLLGTLSLVACAVILGVGLTLGFETAPFRRDDGSIVEVEIGLSFTVVGLAILWLAADFIVTLLSKKREGMPPGAHVAGHLVIWLLAVSAVAFISVFITDLDGDYYYGYDYNRSRNYILEQVLLGFDIVLLVVHFILFCRACVETSRFNAQRQKVIYITVPAQGGPVPYGYYQGQQPAYRQAPYPHAPYPQAPYPQAPYPQASYQQATYQQGVPYPNQPSGYYPPVISDRKSSRYQQSQAPAAPYEYYAPEAPPQTRSSARQSRRGHSSTATPPSASASASASSNTQPQNQPLPQLHHQAPAPVAAPVTVVTPPPVAAE
ncbi:hypothetical protein B0T24DRAFT_589496 [Lasiosphaeria ovina]|uniref:Uncharacterized protein n=1 Tax=Lasiosphaeria ovina TaxID=92902 RepID=A0AAE0ND01_9PEZI|nr:hypothetical protein B0T24DRAFT_589496 [Lasiosphaeria ovina]